ncbi:hypothetical protein BpHYR1_012473 [Brachionus plicatilis]|uniref:Uncharacterized protein n=1 Tax=Brachionus plicatilis TaxID=10195 RepID=A0A3M7Q299_BRAPC|nr:hypothetical protein BpHYR1_012473 [Brachionus plicatilis]
MKNIAILDIKKIKIRTIYIEFTQDWSSVNIKRDYYTTINRSIIDRNNPNIFYALTIKRCLKVPYSSPDYLFFSSKSKSGLSLYRSRTTEKEIPIQLNKYREQLTRKNN